VASNKYNSEVKSKNDNYNNNNNYYFRNNIYKKMSLFEEALLKGKKNHVIDIYNSESNSNNKDSKNKEFNITLNPMKISNYYTLSIKDRKEEMSNKNNYSDESSLPNEEFKIEEKNSIKNSFNFISTMNSLNHNFSNNKFDKHRSFIIQKSISSLGVKSSFLNRGLNIYANDNTSSNNTKSKINIFREKLNNISFLKDVKDPSKKDD